MDVVDGDNGDFDMFLMYTGGATFDAGSSMLRKINVMVNRTSPSAPKTLRVTSSSPFGEELFNDTIPDGHDVGGDHAWVDVTGPCHHHHRLLCCLPPTVPSCDCVRAPAP